MKITMLNRRLGSDRNKAGIALPVRRYHVGETYEVCDELGQIFIDGNDAELSNPVYDRENKDLGHKRNKTKKNKAKKS